MIRSDNARNGKERRRTYKNGEHSNRWTILKIHFGKDMKDNK